ncbi:MAG: threonine-phosphate decarboxylase CobD [bacterium]
MKKIMELHGGNLKEAQQRYRLKKEEIIDFSANINPLGFPNSVGKIISSHLDDIARYPDPYCKDLKKAIASRLNISADNLLIGNGSMDLIFSLTLALKPKRALISIPTFSEYERAVRLAGGKCLFVKTHEANDFAVNTTEIIKRLDSTDLLFICNPNNPTGFLWDKEAVRFLADKCEKKGVFLVIDEAFMDFVEEKNASSMVTVMSNKKHVLVLRSLTKFFAIAGLRAGYLAGNKKLLSRISSYQPPWSVNALAQMVACEIIKDTVFIKKSRDYVLKESNFLFKELQKIKSLKPYPASANFIFCRLENKKINAGRLCDYCGGKGILIRDCSNFRGLDDRFIRVAVRRREANLRLISCLKEYLYEL